MIDINFFDYQIKAQEDIKKEYARGVRKVLYVLPAGGGKTYTFCGLGVMSANRGKRVLTMAHKEELIDQICVSYAKIGQKVRIEGSKSLVNSVRESVFEAVGADMIDQDSPVMVSTVQTISSRKEKIETPDFMIYDEAHHCPARTYSDIADHFQKAYILGVTATPCRLTGRSLGDFFDSMVMGPKPSELIYMGRLVPSVIYSIPSVDFSGVGLKNGDYDLKELENVIQNNQKFVYGSVYDNYIKFGEKGRAVLFAPTVKVAYETAESMREKGLRWATLEGKLSSADRRHIVRSLRNGDLDGVSNRDIVSEGFDLPALSVAIFLRKTASTSFWIQAGARALRAEKGKTHGIILDHVGNAITHLEPDLDRDYTLGKDLENGRPSMGSRASLIKTCAKCKMSYLKASLCPFCGNASTQEPPPSKYIAGELKKVKNPLETLGEKDKKRYIELCGMRLRNGQAPILLRDWQKLAKEKGYQKGWGWHCFKFLQACRM